METPEAAHGLSFERAAYTVQPAGGPPCANCAGPLGEQYWQWMAKPFCAGCRGKMMELFAASQSRRAFGRAALFGGLTALGTGIAYAAFVAFTHYQFALVTIGIAFLIAKVMRRSSGGIGGRKYQILAVALTYLASSMGYMPWVYQGLKGAAADHSAEHAPESTAAQRTQAEDASSKPRLTAVELVVSLMAFAAFTLATPVLAAKDAPIGLLIVGFGLWEAWKLTRGLPLTLDGPYRTAAATGPPAG